MYGLGTFWQTGVRRMHRKAKTITKHFFLCPNCGIEEKEYEHLLNRRRGTGPWLWRCDECNHDLLMWILQAADQIAREIPRRLICANHEGPWTREAAGPSDQVLRMGQRERWMPPPHHPILPFTCLEEHRDLCAGILCHLFKCGTQSPSAFRRRDGDYAISCGRQRRRLSDLKGGAVRSGDVGVSPRLNGLLHVQRCSLIRVLCLWMA